MSKIETICPCCNAAEKNHSGVGRYGLQNIRCSHSSKNWEGNLSEIEGPAKSAPVPSSELAELRIQVRAQLNELTKRINGLLESRAVAARLAKCSKVWPLSVWEACWLLPTCLSWQLLHRSLWTRGGERTGRLTLALLGFGQPIDFESLISRIAKICPLTPGWRQEKVKKCDKNATLRPSTEFGRWLRRSIFGRPVFPSRSLENPWIHPYRGNVPGRLSRLRSGKRRRQNRN